MQDENAKRLHETHASALASIVELVEALTAADKADDDEARDTAREAIETDPLSVLVRDGWMAPGTVSDGPVEYEILLSTGGPATRIVGDLNEHREPITANLEVQDWFQPWTRFPVTGDEGLAVLAYAQVFWFGE